MSHQEIKAKSFYTFNIRASNTAPEYRFFFEFLPGFKLLSFDNAFSVLLYDSDVLVYTGLKRGEELGELDFQNVDYDDDGIETTPDTWEDFIPGIRYRTDIFWDVFYPGVGDNYTVNLNDADDEKDASFDSVDFQNLFFYPTKNFIAKAKQILESLQFEYVFDITLPDVPLLLRTSVSGTDDNESSVSAASHVYFYDDSNGLPWSFYDVNDKVLFGAGLHVDFAEDASDEGAAYFTAPLIVSGNANSAFVVTSPTTNEKQIAFFWFGVNHPVSEPTKPLILDAQDFDAYLQATAILGGSEPRDRLPLFTNAGVHTRQVKTTFVDGEEITETVFKGFQLSPTYAFLLSFAAMLMGTETAPLTNIDGDNFQWLVNQLGSDTETWTIGFTTSLNSSDLNRVEYPHTTSTKLNLTTYWNLQDVHKETIGFKFNGELFEGEGQPVIHTVQTTQTQPIYLNDESQTVLSANSANTPTTFTIQIPFIKTGNIELEADNFKLLEHTDFSDVRLYIADSNGIVFFISDPLDYDFTINENTGFDVKVDLRFFTTFAETLTTNESQDFPIINHHAGIGCSGVVSRGVIFTQVMETRDIEDIITDGGGSVEPGAGSMISGMYALVNSFSGVKAVAPVDISTEELLTRWYDDTSDINIMPPVIKWRLGYSSIGGGTGFNVFMYYDYENASYWDISQTITKAAVTERLTVKHGLIITHGPGFSVRTGFKTGRLGWFGSFWLFKMQGNTKVVWVDGVSIYAWRVVLLGAF